MSLIIEQKLDNFFFTDGTQKVYSTGVKLISMEIKKNGKSRFVWVVDEFCDDSYDENGNMCQPNVYSDRINELLKFD